MARKTANTPKASKPAGKAAKKAANDSSEKGLNVSRERTRTRGEVREINPQQQGHPK